MHHVIKGGSAFASLRVELDREEGLKAAKGAMLAMSGDISLSARADGGLLRSIARKFTGTGFFFQNIRAEQKSGWVMLAPPMPGAITAIELHGRNVLNAEQSTFLAATSDIEISSTLQRPFKALFGSSGLTAIKATGPGLLFLCGFGAIEPLTLLPDQDVLVDLGHLMAWDDTVTIQPAKGGTSWSSALLGGEGLVGRVKGPGRIWLQTRTQAGFREWLGELLPPPEISGKSNEHTD